MKITTPTKTRMIETDGHRVTGDINNSFSIFGHNDKLIFSRLVVNNKAMDRYKEYNNKGQCIYTEDSLDNEIHVTERQYYDNGELKYTKSTLIREDYFDENGLPKRD